MAQQTEASKRRARAAAPYLRYVVANPRGIPEGIRILAIAPRHGDCAGEGCDDCDDGRVLQAEWFEGDAIAEADVGDAWAEWIERGFVVEAS